MWALSNLKAGGPCLTRSRPAPPSLSFASLVAGQRLWRSGPVRAPLVAVHAAGGRRKDRPGAEGDGDEAESKASYSGPPGPALAASRAGLLLLARWTLLRRE
uniref:Uncharacterized protein n=1 Tax=Arundo donax TaxID=35708 RepID=A0A0A8Y280_ARUDO